MAFEFLDNYLDGLNGIQTTYDAEVGGAIGGLGANIFGADVARENAKTRAKVNKINTNDAALELRYNLGMSKVVEATQGGGYGDSVFRAAENARENERRMNKIKFEQAAVEAEADAQTPDFATGVFDFVDQFVNARAKRNVKISQYSGLSE